MALRSKDWTADPADHLADSSVADEGHEGQVQSGRRREASARPGFARLGAPPGSVVQRTPSSPFARQPGPATAAIAAIDHRAAHGRVQHMLAAQALAQQDAAIAGIRHGAAHSQGRETLQALERAFARTGQVPAPAPSPAVRAPVFGAARPPFGKAAAAAPAPFPYDEHQLELINRDDRILIGRAIAGAGKTTSAIGFAQARPDRSLLYLAFGANNAKEAKGRFPANTTCSTIHALAFQTLPPSSRQRVTGFWRAADIATALHVDVRTAANCGRVLAAFYCSTARQLGLQHTDEVRAKFSLDERECRMALEAAQHAWRLMNEPGSRLPLVHDAYLKAWTLTNPVLRYDHIILDEAQDTNPITEQLVTSQLGHARLLAIGDPHQSIYAFRGATNAMENLCALPGAQQVTMPRTWRFGEKTAAFANTLLSNLKGETIPIQGMGRDGPWSDAHFTMLARTNAELFMTAAERQGRGTHWMGGIEKYAVHLIEDAYRIYSREPSLVRDAFLRKFRTWAQLAEYADNTHDAEIKRLIRAVDTYKHDTPQVIEQVRDNAEPHERDAQLVLTTAHKAKGMEWDCVRIAQDFEFLFEVEKELCEMEPGQPLSLPSVQEINLLYVAATRAKKCVQLNPESELWLKELPKLQGARAATDAARAARHDESGEPDAAPAAQERMRA